MEGKGRLPSKQQTWQTANRKLAEKTAEKLVINSVKTDRAWKGVDWEEWRHTKQGTQRAREAQQAER